MLQTHPLAIFSAIIFWTVHTDTICACFRFESLSRAFLNRCVFHENAKRISVQGTPKLVEREGCLKPMDRRKQAVASGNILIPRDVIHLASATDQESWEVGSRIIVLITRAIAAMFVIVGSGYCLLRQARKPEVRESQTIRSDPARALDSGAGQKDRGSGNKNENEIPQ